MGGQKSTGQNASNPLEGAELVSNAQTLSEYQTHSIRNYKGETFWVELPVEPCGASGPGHHPHRSSHVGAYANHMYHGDWTWCPGSK